MLIVATGDGKGKTTAAIGQAIRALGHGKKVFFAQFIKSDKYPSGEDVILRRIKKNLTFIKGGEGFVGILGDTLPLEMHKAAAMRTLTLAQDAAVSGKYDLVILDEANVAVSLGLITKEALCAFLDAVPCACDVVITGRNADSRVLDRADFVTDCVEVKHPFHNKVHAREGIEF